MFSRKQKQLSQTTKYKLQKTSSGFTLIEILLVTFISGLVFVGIYLLYASTIKQDVESRYEVIASNLAQEGIEIIRNRRDEEILAGNAIDDTWPNTSGANCYPVYNGTPGSGECRIAGMFAGPKNVGLKATGYYNCNGSCPGSDRTPFQRVCNIVSDDTDSTPGDDTLTVICTVSWDSFVNPAISRKIEATSVLTDWDAN